MNSFLALTSPGIENLLADELELLSATDISIKPEGVYFSANLETAYNIVLWCRFATRILLQLGTGEAANKSSLYQTAMQIDWCDHFDESSTFAIDFVGTNFQIKNSQFGALIIKDAIVDCFREQELRRPNVDKHNCHIRFQARLKRDQVAIYLDFSGRGLFQRGYRKDSGAAPLKEHLAAALVARSGWLENTAQPLIDPMCGSGTILIEAASMAAECAANVDREYWGFEHWLNHNKTLWQQQFQAAQELSERRKANYNGNIKGFDLDGRVLKTAQANIRKAGFEHTIKVQCQDATQLTNNEAEAGVILFNPPYGERLGEMPELVATFNHLGHTFKQQFVHWKLAIFTANKELLGLLKLASSKRYKLKNGPLDCQLALYELTEQQVQPRENAHAVVDSPFANRLKKNLKQLKSWLKQNNFNCYRIYDADIPEYNAAVDVYGDYVVIHEYAAPANIPEEKTQQRLQQMVLCVPEVLNVSPQNVVLKTRSRQKGKNQYQKVNKTDRTIIVHEYGAQFYVNLWDYLDTGLFLDHRKTRQLVASKAKGKSVLNLFAYTGSVSVQAALHGAKSVTTVDMSKTYLNWAENNFTLNKLAGRQFQFIQADCLQWLNNNQQTYDLVFIDPPTFSNSKRMENTFDVQRDHVELLKNGMKAVSKNGELIFTNNKRHFKMDQQALEELGFKAQSLSSQTLDKDFQRNKHIHNSWLITRL